MFVKLKIICFIFAFCILPSALVQASDAIGIPSSLNDRLAAAELAIAVSTNDLAIQASTNALNTRLGTAETTLATATGNVATLQGLMTTTTGNVAAVQSATNALNSRIIAQADTNVGLVPKARNLGNTILNFMADSKEIVSAVRALCYDGSADKISLF